MKTASPPDPPRNVGVTATTCSALSVAWDPPQEHGSEIIGMSACISHGHSCLDLDYFSICCFNLKQRIISLFGLASASVKS